MPLLDSKAASLVIVLDDHLGMRDPTAAEIADFEAKLDPGAAAYARCAWECRERQAGEPECTDTCLRADEARRKA